MMTAVLVDERVDPSDDGEEEGGVESLDEGVAGLPAPLGGEGGDVELFAGRYCAGGEGAGEGGEGDAEEEAGVGGEGRGSEGAGFVGGEGEGEGAEVEAGGDGVEDS